MWLTSCIRKLQDLSRTGYFVGTNGAMCLSVFSRLSGYRNEYVGLGKTLNRASVLPLSNE